MAAVALKTVGKSALADIPKWETTPEQLLRPLNFVERKNAPPRLYGAGDGSLLRSLPKVSVVGARKASPEGLRRAARLARALAERGILVVSGLAEGIDTAAHEAAIAAGGRTAAVLGSPLDVAFPAHNRELQRKIMEDHVAVSQFPSGHPILKTNFPRRNRTMAVLSDATIIVEASDGSGSLSQGWEALRLKRPLLLLKSIVEATNLTWPAEMIAYGAEVVSDPEEVFDLLALELSEIQVELAF